MLGHTGETEAKDGETCIRNKQKGRLFSGVFIHERKKGRKEKNGT